MTRTAVALPLILFITLPAAPDVSPLRLRVTPGFVVEKVAGPPLVRYPLFATFDDEGRLFVAEGTGTNLPGADLLKLKKQLGRITLLEDTDGDGVFDKATPFADDLTFPTGVLWHDGILYAASHPNLWRFVEGRREPLVGSFNFNGNGCDIHGPFLGPDGWLYWTDGRHGYKVRTREGELLEGLAARVWRCRPDGGGIERICGGGFDNPVELTFTEAGDVIGTMDQGPGDALLHYVEGGVYPMDHPCVKEFVQTGPMLGAVHQYGAALPVALCGLTRYRSASFGDPYRDCLFTVQYNVHRVTRHTLAADGATFRSAEHDFLSSSDYDTRFTDVLEDLDRLLQAYPEKVRAAARPLRERLAGRRKEQAAYLNDLDSQLRRISADAARGKEVLFSRKTTCAACHSAAGLGGSVGPDLSQAGRFRTCRDLLESIVFPSSSIVPEFRAFTIHTRDGRVTVGMVVRETTDALFLRTAQLAEVRLARADVEEMTPSQTSIMSEGLERTVSAQAPDRMARHPRLGRPRLLGMARARPQASTPVLNTWMIMPTTSLLCSGCRRSPVWPYLSVFLSMASLGLGSGFFSSGALSVGFVGLTPLSMGLVSVSLALPVSPSLSSFSRSFWASVNTFSISLFSSARSLRICSARASSLAL
jgi:putative membrane-bound dehydrogenase-like protein